MRKDDILKFVTWYFFGALEILFSQNSRIKVTHLRYRLDFFNNLAFSGPIYFSNRKITYSSNRKTVDGKLRSISFRNNLVASFNIENCWREAALSNTGHMWVAKSGGACIFCGLEVSEFALCSKGTKPPGFKDKSGGPMFISVAQVPPNRVKGVVLAKNTFAVR